MGSATMKGDTGTPATLVVATALLAATAAAIGLAPDLYMLIGARTGSYRGGTRSMLGCAASNAKNVEHNLPLILHGWSCGILYGISGLRPEKLGSKSGYEKL